MLPKLPESTFYVIFHLLSYTDYLTQSMCNLYTFSILEYMTPGLLSGKFIKHKFRNVALHTHNTEMMKVLKLEFISGTLFKMLGVKSQVIKQDHLMSVDVF